MTHRKLTARVDQCLQNAHWDAFVATAPGGHHTQSSAWAATKRAAGWRSVRVLIEEEEKLLGGGQLLYTALPGLGAVAYLPKGPALASADSVVLERFMERLAALARDLKVRWCIVQPAEDSPAADFPAASFGYTASAVSVGPIASVRIPLDQDDQALMAAMRPSTRSGIRQGLKRGITVRRAARSDLGRFHRLLESTATRRGFAPEPLAYYHHWWDCFHPNVQLFFAEQAGRLLSAAFTIAFGSILYYKRGAWTGGEGRLHPNEVLHWEILHWARSAGFRWYDLEGIDRGYAEQRLAGRHGPFTPAQSLSHFKTGFGRPVLYPPAYQRFFWPPLRFLTRLQTDFARLQPVLLKAFKRRNRRRRV